MMQILGNTSGEMGLRKGRSVLQMRSVPYNDKRMSCEGLFCPINTKRSGALEIRNAVLQGTLASAAPGSSLFMMPGGLKSMAWRSVSLVLSGDHCDVTNTMVMTELHTMRNRAFTVLPSKRTIIAVTAVTALGPVVAACHWRAQFAPPIVDPAEACAARLA